LVPKSHAPHLSSSVIAQAVVKKKVNGGCM